MLFLWFQWGHLGWGSCWSSGHWTWRHCDSSECWKLHAQWQTQHISQKNWICTYSWSLPVLTWSSLGVLGLLNTLICTVVFMSLCCQLLSFCNIGVIALTRENWRTQNKTCSLVLSSTNSTNPGIHGERVATISLNCGMSKNLYGAVRVTCWSY